MIGEKKMKYGDLISRQAAVDEFPEDALPWDTFDGYIAPHHVRKILEQMPSAQPEIIYCKDCKWKQGAECVRFADVRPFPSDFCSRAERREE